jgi:hypothetical protein
VKARRTGGCAARNLLISSIGDSNSPRKVRLYGAPPGISGYPAGLKQFRPSPIQVLAAIVRPPFRVTSMVHDSHKSWDLVFSYIISVAVIAFIAMLMAAGMFDRFFVH